MATAHAVIHNRKGIHVRPSGCIFKYIMNYTGHITVTYNNENTSISDIIAIIALGLKQGDEIDINVTGPEEKTMLQGLKELFEKTYEFEER